MTSTTAETNLLTLTNVSLHFGGHGRRLGVVRAVDGVSFELRRGETLGLVGESGCGKSTLGRCAIGMLQPTSGSVRYLGAEVPSLKGRKLRRARRDMQMVFQDPSSSLDPRWTVEHIIEEPLRVHRVGDASVRGGAVAGLIDQVGLAPEMGKRHPHELSGGQRQRVAIARALALSPKVVVCDEALSALDASVGLAIANLLRSIKESLDVAYLFISHDLNAVRRMADRVAVMYLGQLVELGEKREIYAGPLHPYTQALLSAVPVPDPGRERRRERIVLSGDVPNAIEPPSGCRFHTRCPLAIESCRSIVPEWRQLTPGHWVACHRAPDESLIQLSSAADAADLEA